MAERIEDYALLGDLQTAALVGRSGSIDWLCVPRFDSGACLAGLLGGHEHGRWLVAPSSGGPATWRRYRDDSLILESEWQTGTGHVRVIDFMPVRGDRNPEVVRIVEGLEGSVQMSTELILRFDYGSIVPWVRRLADGSLVAVGGPDAICLHTPVELHGEGMTSVAEFTVRSGDRVPFVLTWFPSAAAMPAGSDAEEALRETTTYWGDWLADCHYDGAYPEAVRTSLMVLKAQTYAPTGGIVAAPTTSLPEWIGGGRNWDYRFCWVRDATFTLYSLMNAGYLDEAKVWRDWLLRAAAGDAEKLQILYGVAGERRVQELELGWLPGYGGSAPVRVGNAAHEQFQIDVYGELIDALHQSRRHGLAPDGDSWSLEVKLMRFLGDAWRRPDEGIWEVRGPRRHFVHSKVLAWVAYDRVIDAVERYDLRGPIDDWRATRAEIHAEVCANGFDATLNAFTQSYGSASLDASTLLIPLVGFLPPDDPRVVGTVERIQSDLMHDGFVLRYATAGTDDGLSEPEGAFLPCSFWLVDALALMGREGEARTLFERLLAIRNDLGLLSEEYDPTAGRLLGNFPQAFTHVGLVNSAFNLSAARHRPMEQRASGTRCG